MILTRDLEDEAELFSASSGVQNVAIRLRKIIDGQEIKERDKEHFEWGGQYFWTIRLEL